MSYYHEADHRPVHGNAAGEAGEGTGLGTLMNWLGAAVSVALFGGFMVWGYQLAVRDVSGVPVIKALDGPIRTVAEDPGGQVTDRPALAVDKVQSTGAAEKPADRVILAPPPITLSEDDAPAIRPVTAVEVETPIAAGVSRVEDVVGQTDLSDPARARAERRQALEGGLVRSLRPRARPVVRVATTDIEAAINAAVGKPVDAAPEEVKPGDRLVQLGAFDHEAEARDEWERLLGLHADLLGEKKRLIQRAESGGKAFYRLRAVGFADLSDARRMCSALMARRVNCIPVTAR